MADQNKWNGENPWLGLGAYNEGQRLYGRDKEAADLTDIIVNHTASVVYGKSGIGKSSLLRAGVFPQLRQRRFVPIYLRLEHNTDVSYSFQIKNAIKENVITKDILPSDIPGLGLWDFLHRHRFVDDEGDPVSPVVVLDQFEEIFTLTTVEHKPDVQALFTELADVLNDVKPDRVIEAEAAYAQRTAKTEISSVGFTLQSLSKSALCYEKSPSFRVVFSLRDDSLYLLERSSAKIPALKVNRYNLCALDEESALEVVTKPCPTLFSDAEAQQILDGLAYYEYDDYRVVDPAILSLFLYSYYKEQGKLAYTDIFERYYQDCTKDIKEDSISYIEDHLLTERGNRNQIPADELIASGIACSELNLLLQRKILKTEKRKGQDYVEFSHDRLCEQAVKHREERKGRMQARKMRKRMLFVGVASLAVVGLTIFYIWQNRQILKSQVSERVAIAEKDSIRKQKEITQALLNLSEAQKDSIKSQKEAETLLNDSISKLNISLKEKIKIINQNNEDLKFQFDLLLKEAQKDRMEEKKDDLFERKSNNTQNGTLALEQKHTQLLDSLQSLTIQPVIDILTTLSSAIETNDTTAMREAIRELKENASFFSGLRDTENSVFVSSSSDNLTNIDQNVSDDRQTFDKSILTKTVFIKARQNVKLTTFKAKGYEELAVVAEQGGRVTLKIHVTGKKGYDARFDDTVDITAGRQTRKASFNLPSDGIYTVELEIINCTNKDISCVVISN